MTTKVYLWAFLALGISSNAFAADAEQENGYGWQAKLNKASVEISSSHVDNAKEYKNSPNSSLSGDSETVVKGTLDFALEKNEADYLWTNTVFAEYGKTKLKPMEGPDVVNENSDKILLTTDYSRKVWRLEDADVGPFVSAEYQTEFEKNEDAPKTQILRGKSGIKMFEGKYIKVSMPQQLVNMILLIAMQ